MSNDTTITLIGNLTADPDLRFTQSGTAVANLTVAVTPRRYNKQSSEWEDGTAMFWNCHAWNQMAENIAESLTKGARVIVTGRLNAREWEDREGNKRTSTEVEIDDIGPALRYATATVQRGGNREQPANRRQSQPAPSAASQRTNTQPSARQPVRGAWGQAGDALTDEPPF